MTFLTGFECTADPSINAFVTQFIVPEPGAGALLAAIVILKRRAQRA